MSEQPIQRSNTTLWILLSTFVVPAIAAYIYFYYGDRPSSHSNGQLITPVIDIEAFKLTDELGNDLNRDQLTPKWRMFYFVDQNCDEACKESLYNMRQINKALGKNQDRVQHVIVHLNPPNDALIDLINRDYAKAIQLFSQREIVASALKQKDQGSMGSIYLMDPLGNVMMKFTQELKPKLILKDINKLLKISRIG